MKSVKCAVAIAVIFPLVAFGAPPFFKVKIKGTRYHTESPFEVLTASPFGNADLVSRCTQIQGAQLVAQAGSIEDIPSLILTVDPCGNVICTNFILTSSCIQDAATSNGTSETDTIAARVHYADPQGLLSGDGFLLAKATGIPTDPTVVHGYSTKGTFTLCQTNQQVINGTITISGLFKPAPNCPQ